MENKNKIMIAAALMAVVIGYFMYHGNDAIDQKIVEIVAETKNDTKEPVVIIESSQALQELLDNNKKPYVIFCHMDDCYWCEQMAPIVQQAGINPDLQDIQMYSVNSTIVNDNAVVQKIIGKNIDGYPFLICMNKGNHIHDIDGYCDQKEFETELKQNFMKV